MNIGGPLNAIWTDRYENLNSYVSLLSYSLLTHVKNYIQEDDMLTLLYLYMHAKGFHLYKVSRNHHLQVKFSTMLQIRLALILM